MPNLAVVGSRTGELLDGMVVFGRLPIKLVIVDRKCWMQSVAKKHGIPCVMVKRTDFSSDFNKVAYTDKLIAMLNKHDIDVVALAGFMTVLGPAICDVYGKNVLNTHNSLLPSFPGAHAVRDALVYGVKITGCTVHEVSEQVDAGPILRQASVPVLPEDTEATLGARIKRSEIYLYSGTLRERLEGG